MKLYVVVFEGQTLEIASVEIVDARLSPARRDKRSYAEVDARSPPGAIESHPVAAAFWLTAS